jgi:hypothetical protein
MGNVKQLAQETLETIRTRAENAAGYAEAHGHSEANRTVLDGTGTQPRERALPGAERVEDADWAEYVILVEAVDQIWVQCSDLDSREDDPEYMWRVQWEGSRLMVIHPDEQ